MPQPQPIPLGELGTEPFGAGTGGVNKPANVPPAPIVVASPLLSPLTNPEPWTYLKAQGQRSPGLIPVEGGVSGFDREEKWDVKGGKGTTGATTTRVGLEPAKGSFTFELPNVDSQNRWAAYLALFKFDTTKGKGEAVTVYHPALASVQPPITSVVMTKHTPVKTRRDGCCVVTIELLEYFKAQPTGATTAQGSKGYTTGKGATGTQEDPAIKKLQAQVQKLSKQLEDTA